jgi:dolichol-phosphate mannosyltransferase
VIKSLNKNNADLVSVIIPVFNNQDSIQELVGRLHNVCNVENRFRFEIIFIDDGSSDQSVPIIQKQKQLFQKQLDIKLIVLESNYGQIAAILAGLKRAGGKCSFVISADLQDEPEMLPKFLNSYVKGFKVVIGRRKYREDSFAIKISSAIGYKLIRRKIKDYPATGFDVYLIDKEVTSTLLEGNDFRYRYLQTEILSLGYQIDSIDYVRRARKYGKSGHTPRSRLRFLSIALMDNSPLLLRSTFGAGVLLLSISLILVLILIINFLQGNTVFQGFITLFTLILLTASVQTILLGIIGEYVWRQYHSTKKRNSYVVRREE